MTDLLGWDATTFGVAIAGCVILWALGWWQ